uniref:Uncharacterized protein n=1 Tax=Ditylenchus dipsaci TaxID=166011 RepID=A0A915D3V3_9BILA
MSGMSLNSTSSNINCSQLGQGCVHPSSLNQTSDSQKVVAKNYPEKLGKIGLFSITKMPQACQLADATTNNIDQQAANYCLLMQEDEAIQTVLQSLRDSMGDLYNMLAINVFGCPDLQTLQNTCLQPPED